MNDHSLGKILKKEAYLTLVPRPGLTWDQACRNDINDVMLLQNEEAERMPVVSELSQT
jgi:hypothetical protein